VKPTSESGNRGTLRDKDGLHQLVRCAVCGHWVRVIDVAEWNDKAFLVCRFCPESVECDGCELMPRECERALLMGCPKLKRDEPLGLMGTVKP